MLVRSKLIWFAAAVLLFLPIAANAQTSGSGNSQHRDPMTPFLPDRPGNPDTPPDRPNSNANSQAPDETRSNAEESRSEKTELDLPESDSIKLHLDPVLPGHVVDRITEDVKIHMSGLHGSTVSVFYVGVDSPYGGKAISKPRLIGEAKVHARQADLAWNGRQSTKYIKVFAVERRGDELVRSHTYDFAIGGSRLVVPGN